MDIMLYFSKPLIGTLLLGVEKQLNNMFMKNYMAKKHTRSQKSHLMSGHKERVFNPIPRLSQGSLPQVLQTVEEEMEID